ncbi:MAG: DUF4345 family protein [Nevskiales bacterium]
MTGYLIVTGILFLIVGLRALLKPIAAVATPYSLNAEGVDARNYLRSGAGGVTIACAAVLIAGGLMPALSFAATVLAVTVLGGLVFGRLVSLALDGNPGPVPWISGVLEALGFAFGAYWLIKSFS